MGDPAVWTARFSQTVALSRRGMNQWPGVTALVLRAWGVFARRALPLWGFAGCIDGGVGGCWFFILAAVGDGPMRGATTCGIRAR